MNRFYGSIDLLKLDKSATVTLKGQECVVIPLAFNPSLKKYTNPSTGKKSVFLGINVIDNLKYPENGKYSIAASCPKEARERMTAEEMKLKCPFVGNMNDCENVAARSGEQATASFSAPQIETESYEDGTEDLPF